MKKILVQLSKVMSVRVLAIGLSFLQAIILTRVLGGELFGLLSFALSIGALATLVLSFGLDQVMMRDIAKFGPANVTKTTSWRDDLALVKWVVTPATLIVTALGLIACLTTNVFGQYTIITAAVFLSLPIVLLRKYQEAAVLGAKEVVRSVLGSQIAYPVLMILGGLALMGLTAIGSSITPTAQIVGLIYLVATLGSFALSVVIGWTVIKRLRDAARTPQEETSQGQRAVFNSGMNFALVSLGFVMGQHIDVLLTGVLSDDLNDVSIVRIASRVAELAALMRAIVSLQYKPQLAEAHGQNDMAKLQKLVSTMALIFVITGLPITIGLWIFAEPVMAVFGPEFVEGAWAMRIYVLGIFFTMACGPCTVLLSMAGQERIASRILWISLCLNIILDVILIPIYGPVGCAIANLVSLCFMGVASVIMDNRVLKIMSRR